MDKASSLPGVAATLELRLPGGIAEVSLPTFDARTYVSQLRRVLPILQLRSALEREVTELGGKLTELVNDRHADVVELANDLRGVTTRLPSVRENLQHYTVLCNELLNKASGIHEEIESILDEHALLQAQRSYDKAALLVYKTAQSNLKDLRSIQEPPGAAATYLLLELLAAEAQWTDDVLKYLEGSKGRHKWTNEDISSDTLNIEAVLRRLNDELKGEIKQRLREALETTFSQLQEDGSNEEILDSVIHVMAGFLNLKCESEVIDTIRQLFATPTIQKALDASFGERMGIPSSQSGMASRADVEALSVFLEVLRQEGQQAFSPVFKFIVKLRDTNLVLADQVFDNKISLMSSAIIQPILKTIEDKFSTALVPVYPDLFIKNFRLVNSVVDTLFMLYSESDHIAFRKSHLWTRFEARWRTQVYEATRYRSLLTAVNRRLNAEPPALLELGASQFRLEATDILVKSAFRLLDKEQLIAKERSRVIRSIAEAFLLRLAPDSPKSTGGTLSYALYDVIRLIPLVNSEQSGISNTTSVNLRLAAAPTSISPEKRNVIFKIFDAIVNDLSSMKQRLEDLLVNGVIGIIERELLAMRGVPPVYRMTNRQVTSASSPYVTAVINVLKDFEVSMKEESREPWLFRALEKSFDLFGIRLSDVLSAVETQEVSLKRLQKRKAQDLTGGMNDAEKIAKQLLIDGKTFLESWTTFIESSEQEISLKCFHQSACTPFETLTMVYLLMINSRPEKGQFDETRILFSHFFNTTGTDPFKPERLKVFSKCITEEYWATRWIKENETNKSSSCRDRKNEFELLDIKETLSPVEGCLTISSPFPPPEIPKLPKEILQIIWFEVDEIIYSLFCYSTLDNVYIARPSLIYLISCFVDHFRSEVNETLQAMPSPSKISRGQILSQLYEQHPGALLGWVNLLIPGGQLQLLNISSARYLQHQIEQLLECQQ